MLPARHRLRRREDFQAATRGRGTVRRGSSLLVVHARLTTDSDAAAPARVGFVVSKAVGNSVVRTRTKRRLRHLVRDRLALLPAGCDVVVRANPACAGASTPDLAADLDRLLRRVVAGSS